MKKCFVVLMLLLLLSPLALRFAYPESRPLQAEPGEPGFLDSLLGKQPPLIRAWGRINSLWGDSGSPQVFSLKSSRVTTVTASGFFMSLPSLAKILLKDTPMLTVRPVSSLTARRILSARCRPSVSSPPEQGMDIQFSSMPKGSIRSAYRR